MNYPIVSGLLALALLFAAHAVSADPARAQSADQLQQQLSRDHAAGEIISLANWRDSRNPAHRWSMVRGITGFSAEGRCLIRFSTPGLIEAQNVQSPAKSYALGWKSVSVVEAVGSSVRWRAAHMASDEWGSLRTSSKSKADEIAERFRSLAITCGAALQSPAVAGASATRTASQNGTAPPQPLRAWFCGSFDETYTKLYRTSVFASPSGADAIKQHWLSNLRKARLVGAPQSPFCRTGSARELAAKRDSVTQALAKKTGAALVDDPWIEDPNAAE